MLPSLIDLSWAQQSVQCLTYIRTVCSYLISSSARKETNVPQMDRRYALLCTATNKKLLIFLFWTATKTNYILKCSDFQEKLIDTITTNNFYLRKQWKLHGCTSFLGCFLFQPMTKPNRPNSWFRQCCHSTPYIFHGTIHTICKHILRLFRPFSLLSKHFTGLFDGRFSDICTAYSFLVCHFSKSRLQIKSLS